MKTLIPIPTYVITRLTDSINQTYATLPETAQAKLFTKSCELWFHIQTAHFDELRRVANQFHNNHINNIYVNIPTAILSKIQFKLLGTVIQYTDIIKILVNSNLIQVNHVYSAGRYPKAYRPNPDIRYDLIQNIELDLSKFIAQQKSQEQLIAKYPDYAKQIKDLYQVHINLSEFYISVDELIGQTYKYEKAEPVILTADRAYDLKIRAIKINLGLHFFSVSNTGRIYSSLANLPKLAIPHLTLAGQKPVELDAANCQPLLLNAIIKNTEFLKDCESGIFYDKLAHIAGISRTEFKLLSYAKIFFNNKKIDSKTATLLDSAYPGLSAQINQYKAKSTKAASTMPSEQLLWHKLQSLEAQIFVRTLRSQLTPCITRHDSILCLPDEAENIRTQLINQFAEFGLQVTIK